MPFKHFIIRLLLSGLIINHLQAQKGNGFSVKITRDIKTPVYSVFNPMQQDSDWVNLDNPEKELPMVQGMSEKVRKEVDAARARKSGGSVQNRGNYGKPMVPDSLNPKFDRGFEGSSGSGTPNDNHVAVSNNGTVISVLNTLIRVYNDTGKVLKLWGLGGFVNKPNIKKDPIPVLNRTFDPRVLYDPIADRFMVIFMNGADDKTSLIVVGFSSTNNPLDPWYVYKIPGKPTKDTIWSDYPIVSHNRHDLFFTVNLIGTGATWEEGFTEAVIWQINKSDGYEGDTLYKNVYTGIKHNDKSLRSICSIQNGPLPDGNDSYFASVRPIDKINDTLFMMRVTNTQKSGLANLEMTLLKTDIPYGFPPSALQPDTSYKLRTNDVRILSGIRIGNTIQYMQNCINFKTQQAHLTHGNIYEIDKAPFIRVQLISDDSLDMGYPALASAGNSEGDPSTLITFVYSSPWHYPGTAMIYRNRYGEYSKIVKIKKGSSLIYYNFLKKDEQRWGDYEGIQAKYNEKGVFYLVGSYGKTNEMFAYIAKVKIHDGLWDQAVSEVRVFPVPSIDDFYTEIKVVKEGNYGLVLFDQIGKKVKNKPSMFLPAGTHRLRINPDDLAPGIYILHVLGPNEKKIHSQKIQIQ